MKREYVIPDFLAAVTADALLAGRPSLRADEPPALRARPSMYQAAGAAMKTLSRFFDWLNSAIANAERKRNEAYLARATDIFDLEYRMRQLERSAIANLRGW